MSDSGAPSSASPPPPYRVVPAGAARADPYEEAYGPSPYASEPGNRYEVAFNAQHPNSPAAVAEIVARGAVVQQLVLILRCAEKHKKKQRASN
jgi:hypothetical protein